MVLYTSEDAHYSIKKMAVLQGIGSENVYLIKTDARGKMDTLSLIHISSYQTFWVHFSIV